MAPGTIASANTNKRRLFKIVFVEKAESFYFFRSIGFLSHFKSLIGPDAAARDLIRIHHDPERKHTSCLTVVLSLEKASVLPDKDPPRFNFCPSGQVISGIGIALHFDVDHDRFKRSVFFRNQKRKQKIRDSRRMTSDGKFCCRILQNGIFIPNGFTLLICLGSDQGAGNILKRPSFQLFSEEMSGNNRKKNLPGKQNF